MNEQTAQQRHEWTAPVWSVCGQGVATAGQSAVILTPALAPLDPAWPLKGLSRFDT